MPNLKITGRITKMKQNYPPQDTLSAKFIHHSWFKEGVTKKHALNYFANHPDFYLVKKPSSKTSDLLFEEQIYSDYLVYRGKTTQSYKLSKEEKQYYLQCKLAIKLSLLMQQK